MNQRWLTFALIGLAGLLTPGLGAQPGDTAWQSVRVPGAWETNGPAAALNHDGFAWYRAWLKAHDSFFTPHERNLFAESVTLNVRDLADAHEVFVNGTRIGGGGTFPPQFSSGRAGNHRHKIPPGLLRKGKAPDINRVLAGDVVNEHTGVRHRLGDAERAHMITNARTALERMIEITSAKS